MTHYQIVGANIDTWLINIKGKLPDGLAAELDYLKEASQEADEDIRTRWTFADETLFIEVWLGGNGAGSCPAPMLATKLAAMRWNATGPYGTVPRWTRGKIQRYGTVQDRLGGSAATSTTAG